MAKITTTKHNERQAIAGSLQTIREEFTFEQLQFLWEVWGRGNDLKRLSDLKRLRREVMRLARAIQRARARNSNGAEGGGKL